MSLIYLTSLMSLACILSLTSQTLCSYRIKMDENGAQESHIDFYAQFNSLKA